MASIKTFVALLPERFGDPEFRERFLEVVLGELRRVERLIDRALDQAAPPREDAGAAARVDSTVAWAGEVLAHRLHERGLVLVPAVEEALPPAAIAEDALRQLLLNLMLNAVEASPAGGRIRIDAARANDEIRIDVRDEGPGVPDALRARIFEPFFSTRSDRPGGLGLAISRRIAEEAGGRITLEPSAAPGALFRIALRAAS